MGVPHVLVASSLATRVSEESCESLQRRGVAGICLHNLPDKSCAGQTIVVYPALDQQHLQRWTDISDFDFGVRSVADRSQV